MFIKKIFFLLLVLINCSGISQTYFQRLLNEGSIYHIYEGINKEYLIAGILASNVDGYIAKLDSNFNTIWTKKITGTGIGSIIKVNNGMYYCLSGNKLIKFDEAGNFTLIKSYSINTFMGGYFMNIVQAGPNKLILGGNVQGGGNPNDWMVTVMDTLGNISWIKRYGGFSADDGGFVEKLPNGEILVVGEPESNNDGTSNQNYGMIKLDSMGNYIWGKDFGSKHGEFGRMAKFTSDNYITYLGYGSDSISGLNSPLVAKFDLSGNIIWLKKFHFKKDVGIFSFDEDDKGNLIFCGAISDTIYGNTISVGKCLAFSIDKNGTPLWAKSYGDTVFPNDGSSFIGVKYDSRKNIILTGIKSQRQTTVSYFGYLVKADENGNTYCKEKNHSFIGVTPNYFYDVFDSLMPVSTSIITSSIVNSPFNLNFINYCTPPSISSTINNPTICVGNCTVLTQSVTGGVPPFSFTWNPNIGSGPGPYTICPTSNSQYTVIVKDKLNQTFTSVSTISITSVTASLTVSPLNGTVPLQINFSNQSIGATNYSLFFGNSDSSSFVPNYIYNSPGIYTFSFIASNSFNCSDTLDFIITVNRKCDLTKIIPNVFTPNGDGINDVLKFNTCESQKIDCKIFDRWGLLIAEIDKPNGFWDGHTISGQECNEGTYFYVLKITLPQSEEQVIKGFVQLFR